MKKKVYQEITSSFNAYNNCIKSGNHDWEHKHEKAIRRIVNNYLPSGAGLDNGIKFDFEKSTDDKLIFNSAYHVMNNNGYYDGWIDFIFTVRPSLIHEIDISLKGRFSDYRSQGEAIKEYLHDALQYNFTQELNKEQQDELYQ